MFIPRPVDEDRAMSLVQAPTFVQIQSSSKSSLINPYHHNPSNSFNQTQSLNHNQSLSYRQSPGQAQSLTANQSINQSIIHNQVRQQQPILQHSQENLQQQIQQHQQEPLQQHMQQPHHQSPFIQQRHHISQSNLHHGHVSRTAQIRSSNSHLHTQGFQTNPETPSSRSSSQHTPYLEQRPSLPEPREDEIERRSMRSHTNYNHPGLPGPIGMNGYTNHGMNPSESVNSLRELNYPQASENPDSGAYPNPGSQDTRSLPVYPLPPNQELRETHTARLNQRVQGSRPSPSPRPNLNSTPPAPSPRIHKPNGDIDNSQPQYSNSPVQFYRSSVPAPGYMNQGPISYPSKPQPPPPPYPGIPPIPQISSLDYNPVYTSSPGLKQSTR